MPDTPRLICLTALLTALSAGHAVAAPPTNDPTAAYEQSWTDDLPWDRVVDVTTLSGRTWDAKIEAAQDQLGEAGGVIYFPPGEYDIQDTIHLRSGIILRGAAPDPATDAKDADYQPPAILRFPAFEPKLEGEGTPIDTAFKGIHLADPAAARNVGVVHLAIDHGHILFGQDRDHAAGANRLVVGCKLTNGALPDPNVPDATIGQHPWQRFTDRGRAAIHLYTGENALVADNRMPESDASFQQPNYIILGRGPTSGEAITIDQGVRFDYDNRSGIKVNPYSLGGVGGRDPKYTPEERPWGFREGIVIRDNFVYATGRTAIHFTGDGTVCSFNEVRFKKDVRRYTHTGRHLAGGASTNGNRAMIMAGWRYTVEGNVYEVYRNWAADSGYKINDGEGLMHEGHANCVVKDSKIIDNTGNAYLSIYKTAGTDGLLVEGNTFRVPGGAAIYVVSDRNWDRHECRNVTIRDNVTEGGGILIAGEPASGNRVTGNRHEGEKGNWIRDAADALVENNHGYKVAEMTRTEEGRYEPVEP